MLISLHNILEKKELDDVIWPEVRIARLFEIWSVSLPAWGMRGWDTIAPWEGGRPKSNEELYGSHVGILVSAPEKAFVTSKLAATIVNPLTEGRINSVFGKVFTFEDDQEFRWSQLAGLRPGKDAMGGEVEFLEAVRLSDSWDYDYGDEVILHGTSYELKGHSCEEFIRSRFPFKIS